MLLDFFNFGKKNVSALAGKSVLAIGDSITDLGWWVDSIKALTGCEVYNRGVSGTSIADRESSSASFCQRFDLSASNADGHSNGFPTRDKIDVVVVWGGINDFGYSVPVGDVTAAIDRTTFAGALRYLLDGLKTRYYGKPVVLCSVHNSARSTRFPNWNRATFNNDGSFEFRTNSENKKLSDYHEVQKNVCDILGIPFIDMFECGVSFMSEYDFENYSYEQGDPATPDGLHPNQDGSAIIARFLSGKICGILP